MRQKGNYIMKKRKEFDYLFYKTKLWECAGGNDEFNEETSYSPVDESNYTITITKPIGILYDDLPRSWLNYVETLRYTIDINERRQVILYEDVEINLTFDKSINDLKMIGYENEYGLLMYDSVANKTIKYKVIKEKEIEGYHPVL